MSAEQFLQAIEDNGFLDPKKLARLRKELSKAGEDMSVKKLARTLIRGGYITEYQAQRVFANLKTGTADGDSFDKGDEDDVIELQPVEEDSGETLVPLEPDEELDGDWQDEPVGSASVEPDDPWAEASLAQGGPAVGGAVKPAKPSIWNRLRAGRSVYRKRGNQWDSPLMLFGGGGLLLLLIIGFVLWLFLVGETGDELFQAAQDDYASQSYSHAISKYGKYLDKAPDHPKVSLARARRGLARMRQNVERGNDWERALTTANEVLPEIKGEEAFNEVRAELSGILPEIYDGFVTGAESEESIEEKERLLEKGAESLTLINNSEYMPTSQRRSQQARIDGTSERVALIRRDIKREKDLDVALEKIDSAVQANDTRTAFEVRNELLNEYPGLRTNSRLSQSVLGVAAKQLELVEVSSDSLEASSQDHEPAGIQQVVLSDTRGDRASGADGKTIAVLVQGALYGLDAATGKVLWRRWIGFESTMHPQKIEQDFLVVDQRRDELLRLEGLSGKLVWRRPAADVAGAPVVSGARIYVPEASGRLVVVANSGSSQQQVKFPQRLSTSPTTDASAGVIYQIADHSSLYVFDQQTLECQSVLYIGHQPGSVVAPPVICSGMIFVAQNDGVDFSVWRTFAFDKEASQLVPIGEPRRLDGHVVVSPVVFGQRVLVSTDRGAVYVFEVDPASAEEVVRLVAEKVATAKRPVTGFPLVDQRSVYLGQTSLLRLDLQTARGKLVRKWVVDDGDTQLAPLEKYGDYLFHVRKSRRTGSIFVSATPVVGDGRNKRIWQTEIAISPATEPFMNRRARSVVVLAKNGKAWEIGGSHIKSGLSGPAAEGVADGGSTAWTQPIKLASGALVLSPASPGARLPGDNVAGASALVYEPQNGDGGIRTLSLDVGQQRIGWTMAGLGDELLVCTPVGPVYVLNRKTGKQSLLPFQPPIVAGEATDWLRPAIVNAEQRRFALANATGKMYLVSEQAEPKHLAAAAEVDVPAGWTGMMAAVGDSIYVVNNASAPAGVAIYSSSDLSAQPQIEMDGEWVWGPERVGEVVLVATDRRLYGFGGQHELKWDVELGFGPLAGTPLELGNELVMTSIGGQVWRMNRDSGELVAWSGDAKFLDVGQPLGSGPASSGKRLLLLSSDGTLLVVKAPPGLDGS